jgi:UDP-N-acetylglucosamine acyltransferase
MSNIHTTAIIEEGAKIADSAKIGPYCTIGKDAVISENVELISHVSVLGKTTIGEGTKVFPFATLGGGAQHLKHMDDDTATLTIGKNNVIREHVTMHLGTPIGDGSTKVGDNCLFMVNTHVAHDCVVGNNIVMTNNAVIGGHVHVDDFVILGGNSAVHQWCRIGTRAMVGGMTGVEKDVIPYGLVMGDRAKLCGLNLVGLKRGGYSKEEINELRKAYRLLFANEGTLAERIDDAKKIYSDHAIVKEIIEFIQGDSHRNICLAE